LGFGFLVLGFEFWVLGFRSRDSGLEFVKVWGSCLGFSVQGLLFEIQADVGLGFRVENIVESFKASKPSS